MQVMIQSQHEELLELIARLSDGTISEQVSSIMGNLRDSSNSLALLPAKPKIFHGRESELQHIANACECGPARIAILGAGGIGKTSLARAVLHHPTVTPKYEFRLFVGCESATTSIELAALVAVHLGLKPGTDLTQPVVSYLSKGPNCLLVLDNLETCWEPMDSRVNIEDFLSLLADINHLALIITMRGAERPAKVAWTRPFLAPLNPLTYEAARQTFVDIADDFENNEEIDKLLSITDNLPLAIDLIAHLVNFEDCSVVLARWETEKTSMLSVGHNRLSNLDSSIRLSLSSPRITCLPGTKDLLSILSILPNGLSEVVLLQSKLPIKDIRACRTALLRTSLAYTDNKNQLKLLAPVREYIYILHRPSWELILPLQKHFYQLLEFYHRYCGQLPDIIPLAQTTSQLANIQNILLHGFQHNIDDLGETVHCAISE
ncbi:P-loop containing nucleoside triphosphate hydrolase protein [Mycena latifolia]|nr:P-loop containing nucleoside triphosphate hydrolase protein [Mycena latifolia]